MANIIDVESKIITLRDQQVILDADVAELYGVETKRVNEAVSNNPEKFPDGYVWELQEEELSALRSKFSTLKKLGRGQHSKYPPKAFTEKGLYMLATILKSPKAVETTIAIVEAYAKLKELSRVMVAIPQAEESEAGKQEQNRLLQRGGQLIDDLLTDLLPGQSRETSFELNLAMFKFRHSVKRENDAEVRQLKEEIARLKQRLDIKSD
ncbi:MAG: ORF6N domain-containing protein [Bacteroidales bacterium]|nr:ORF6N domain-containing protein [Bacteroidales bacterium]